MSLSRRKKFYTAIIILSISIISVISAWRCLAIFDPVSPNRTTWLVLWFSLTLGFMLIWIVALYRIRHFSNNWSRQQLLAAIVGGIVFGLVGILLTTPAGLFRTTIEIYAEDVWRPDIFSTTWVGDDGSGYMPFSLPSSDATPATLEVIPTGQHNSTDVGEVWLVDAIRSNGSSISLGDFQADGGWKLLQVDWGSHQNKSVWVFNQNQPAPLRWKGMTAGPLTLVFAEHDAAGKVRIRWNGTLEQTFDLYSPTVEFRGITLPVNKPLVWRANVPINALNEDINISAKVNPDDHSLWTLFKKIRIIGASGQTREATGAELLDDLHIENGEPVLTPKGERFVLDKPQDPLQLYLSGPLIADSRWKVTIPWLENILLVSYLALVGVIMVGDLSGFLHPNILTNVNIIIISIIVTALISEVALQLYLPPLGEYYVWEPNMHAVFYPASDVLYGIEGITHFTVNSQGFRGDEASPNDDYRILTIGGSTTECLYLDQSEAWPQLMQDILNKNGKGLQVWVGNVGRSGHSTRENLLQMKYLLPRHADLDAVILLIGINDFALKVKEGESFPSNYLNSPGVEETLMQRAFTMYPEQDFDLLPYYQKSATWRLVHRFQQAMQRAETTAEIDIQDNKGEYIAKRRERRAEAVITNDLLDISDSLEEYSRNINAMIDIAEANNIRVIFATQPTLWHHDLTQEEEDMLWFGYNNRYYSVEALMEGISAYNERLLEICHQRQVECVDLANILPKDKTFFYDDMHFNESGAEQVAGIIAGYLQSQAPFASSN